MIKTTYVSMDKDFYIENVIKAIDNLREGYRQFGISYDKSVMHSYLVSIMEKYICKLLGFYEIDSDDGLPKFVLTNTKLGNKFEEEPIKGLISILGGDRNDFNEVVALVGLNFYPLKEYAMNQYKKHHPDNTITEYDSVTVN